MYSNSMFVLSCWLLLAAAACSCAAAAAVATAAVTAVASVAAAAAEANGFLGLVLGVSRALLGLFWSCFGSSGVYLKPS